MTHEDLSPRARLEASHIDRVREGHGANCSSVGSVVDTLFLGAVAGGVVLAMIAAAMRRESVVVVGGSDGASNNGKPGAGSASGSKGESGGSDAPPV